MVKKILNSIDQAQITIGVREAILALIFIVTATGTGVALRGKDIEGIKENKATGQRNENRINTLEQTVKENAEEIDTKNVQLARIETTVIEIRAAILRIEKNSK